MSERPPRRVRTEAALSLTLAWDPTAPIDQRDVPVLRRFIDAVRDLACLGIRVEGNTSLLERALVADVGNVGELLPEPGLTREETQEKHLLISALKIHKGNQRHAALYIGISEKTVYNRCRYFGIHPASFA